MMSKIPEEFGKKYIAAWREAARVLEEARMNELPMIDTRTGLQSLLPAFELCIRERKLLPTSGLIEQQKIFARKRAQ